MAVGISTIETASEALKTYFKEPIITQINEGSGAVYAALNKKQREEVANAFKITLEYGRHGLIGARKETDDLPKAANRSNKQGTASVKNIFARIQMSEKLMKGSKNKNMSFVDELEHQTKTLVVDAQDMLARNFCTSSKGVMGKVKTVTSNKITVEAGSVSYFYEGQIIDILNDSGGTVTYGAQGVQIKNVDRANGIIELDVASLTGVSAGMLITISGNYGLEMTGLQDILDVDTVLYGIDRSANKWFNPSVFDQYNGGVATQFDSLWMQRAVDDIADNTGDTPKFFVCNRAVQRAYQQEQNTYKRNVEMLKVDGGYNLMAFNGIPISPEKYFMKEAMGVLTTDNFEVARVSDWDWMNAEGNVIKPVPNKAAYEAVLTFYGELLCTKPGSNALIKGIKEIA